MTYLVLTAWAAIAGALLGYHLQSRDDPCWRAIEEYQARLQSSGPDDEAWTEVELLCEDGL